MNTTNSETVVGWQPIEAHDGSRQAVIVVSGGFVGEAYRHEDGDWWWANEGPGDYHAEKIEQPTHWMPLPAAPPPQTGESGEGTT